MKKIATLTLIALSIFALGACSTQSNKSDMKKTDDSSMMKKDDKMSDSMSSSEMKDGESMSSSDMSSEK